MQCLSAPLKPGKGAGWPLGALCRRLAAAWSQSYFRLALTFLLAGLPGSRSRTALRRWQKTSKSPLYSYQLPNLRMVDPSIT